VLSVPQVHTTFASHSFSVAAPQSEIHSHLAFALVRHDTHSVVFLKSTVSSRPSVPPSGLHKCLRFGLWLTLCNMSGFICLLIYLLTVITFTFIYITRSSAVAVIADPTAYNVRYSYRLLAGIAVVSMGIYLFTLSKRTLLQSVKK